MTKQEYFALPTPTLSAENAAIIEAVKAANFMLKDEHGDGTRILPLAGVAAYQDGDRQYVVALFNGSFTSCYTLNAIALRHDGPAVTRNACAGAIDRATDYPNNDLIRLIGNINWDAVAKYPVLAPGQFFNIVLK